MGERRLITLDELNRSLKLWAPELHQPTTLQYLCSIALHSVKVARDKNEKLEKVAEAAEATRELAKLQRDSYEKAWGDLKEERVHHDADLLSRENTIADLRHRLEKQAGEHSDAISERNERVDELMDENRELRGLAYVRNSSGPSNQTWRQSYENLLATVVKEGHQCPEA